MTKPGVRRKKAEADGEGKKSEDRGKKAERGTRRSEVIH
jgi:hypothetical protein